MMPGKKHSKKRDAILRAIQSTQLHPGAQWVYDTLKPEIPGLSLGTVYRNISLFLKEGEVVSVGVVGGEERFDGRVEPHPHAVCLRCGSVTDIPGIDDAARNLLAHGGAPKGFRIDYTKTVFYGLCGACSS
ncbi:MAG: transcriptional repressor [Spirochaetales bacterium]|jgi:Fur family peroxide stress response transcriptional regulator|nr:transcriptional repressor [Spirochaetales bacterium]